MCANLRVCVSVCQCVSVYVCMGGGCSGFWWVRANNNRQPRQPDQCSGVVPFEPFGPWDRPTRSQELYLQRRSSHSHRPGSVVLLARRLHLSPRPFSPQHDPPFLRSRPPYYPQPWEGIPIESMQQLLPRFHQACSSLIPPADFQRSSAN